MVTQRNCGTILLAALVSGMVAGCAVRGVEPSANEMPLMRVAAHGVQIYECRAAPGAAAAAWAFVAPEADLFDGEGRLIGRHGAGPFWRHEDGSGFVGTVLSRAEAPRAHAIPWLLLSARTEGTEGAFGRVSSVQRLNTVGGMAPGTGCAASTLGQRVRMAYRADYVMFVPRLAGSARL